MKMEGERSHRSGSELFVCFTSRPSSSSSSSSMKLASKSILSPGRTDTKFREAPSRRLKSNGSVKGQSSPMFPTGRKKASGFETQEPSSPKVTCIGQVRVKTKQGGRRARARQAGEVSFRGSSKREREQHDCLPHRNQKWAHLFGFKREVSLNICEALRTFGAEFNCFIPCGGGGGATNNGGSESNVQAVKEKEDGAASACGAVFAKWLMVLQESDEKRLPLSEAEVGSEKRRLILADQGEEELEERREVNKVEVEEDDDEAEEEEPTIAVPPRNALLLMRCRSEPLRMSALANRFWDSPVAGEEEHRHESEEEDDEEEEADDEEEDEEEEEEEGVAVTDEVATQEVLLQTLEEEEEEAGLCEFMGLVESKIQSLLQDKEDAAEISAEKEEAAEISAERSSEEHEIQAPERNCTSDDHGANTQETEEGEIDITEAIKEDLKLEEPELAPEEEEPRSPSNEQETAAVVEESNEQETSAVVEEEEREEAISIENAGEAAEEEEAKETEGLEEVARETECSSLEDKYEPEPVAEKPLPQCLLLMMCEPKLSMEVSKETWVCSTDFLHHRPPPPLPPPQPKPQTQIDPTSNGDRIERVSTDEEREKTPCETTVASMAKAIEQKLINAYEPFVLTRCKSEPMRSSARLAPEACFWKTRNLDRATGPVLGVGAAGMGF
ncbi:probable serine/threonine-protein kinase kinX [Amborella trichopoda]|nr:probable serine/threonine-protein kinase kinX [Amborella trichopoda]|eukprot:XP_006852558.2 probable serine/threonine-protein kinase kinX [Amborella trichopoda]